MALNSETFRKAWKCEIKVYCNSFIFTGKPLSSDSKTNMLHFFILVFMLID